MSELIKKIQVIENKEIEESWPKFLNCPSILFKYIADHFFVSIKDTDLPIGVIISDDVPSGSNRRKLWMKTSWPYGMGFLIEGQYRIDYGITGFPVNIPFLHKEIEPAYDYVNKLTEEEILTYGLSNMKPSDSDDYTQIMHWYIFNPPEISI